MANAPHDAMSIDTEQDDDFIDEPIDESDILLAEARLAESRANEALIEPTTIFDLIGLESPSFADIQAGRANVFNNKRAYQGFKSTIEALSDSGEEGRKKGLGLWVLVEYEAASAQLAKYPDDDVATYTRAKSLMALGKFAEAKPLFESMAAKYPDEPRPRGGVIEAAFEAQLATLGADDDPKSAIELLDSELSAAAESFRESADGRYLQGRLAELRNTPEVALGHYKSAYDLDPTLRSNLLHGAYLAERGGLDSVALEMYETLVDLHQADARVFMNLGVLYEDLGRDQDAAACYDIVVQADPTDERARLYLADAKSAMDMYYDEDLERKEDKLNQILRIPITDFELSVRARNCLNKMEIHTLGDLVTKTEQELLSYKNFGETSLNEIKEILRSKNLRLGMPREEAVASIESRSRRPVGSSSESSDVHDKPITDLQLSIRARRTVEALGCLTVGDIVKHSADELLGMPNFGSTSLQELRSKLGDLSVKLTGE